MTDTAHPIDTFDDVFDILEMAIQNIRGARTTFLLAAHKHPRRDHVRISVDESKEITGDLHQSLVNLKALRNEVLKSMSPGSQRLAADFEQLQQRIGRSIDDQE